ncbi:MAG: GrpB family protein [Candidatus Obscuribacterales bacterium]|nr:GrpB family protein [Candidatus Obscuribacterales bacterium]
MITDKDPIVVEKYNSEWPRQYESEATLLKQALGGTIVDIQHIGSTAVPGLSANPIIDIQIAVSSSTNAKDYGEKLTALGYERAYDEQNSANFFCKGSLNAHTHHLYIVETGSDEETRRIVLRDYLRANERGAKEYETLKIAMAEKFKEDRSAYVDAKTAFITLALCMFIKQ